jgi:hypothetical protein
VIVTAVDFDAQPALKLFDVVVKRAAQPKQACVVRWFQGDFASFCVQAVPLICVLPGDKRV